MKRNVSLKVEIKEFCVAIMCDIFTQGNLLLIKMSLFELCLRILLIFVDKFLESSNQKNEKNVIVNGCKSSTII